jgi:hypothetical protein
MIPSKNILSSIILIVTLSFSSFAQNTPVGFACGPSGFPTQTVTDLEKLIINKDYNLIKDELNSLDPGERFLAVVVVGELNKMGRIQLTSDELKQIKSLKKSKVILVTCSGIDPEVSYKLKDLLKNKEDHYLVKYTKYWFKECLKKEVF